MKWLLVIMLLVMPSIGIQANIKSYIHKAYTSRLSSAIKASIFGYGSYMYAQQSYKQIDKIKKQFEKDFIQHAASQSCETERYTGADENVAICTGLSIATGYFAYLCLKQTVRYAAHALDVDCS